MLVSMFAVVPASAAAGAAPHRVSSAPSAGAPVAGRPAVRPRVGRVAVVSRGCRGPNAEAEQAVDYPYVYEAWIGCGGIGFARSTDGGRRFGHTFSDSGVCRAGAFPARPTEERLGPGDRRGSGRRRL